MELTDLAGNIGPVYTGSFLLDTTAPSAPSHLLLNGGAYIASGSQSSIVLTGSGDIAEGGILVDYVIAERDGTGSVSGTGVLDQDGSFTILGIDVSGLMDGVLDFWARLTDGFGNKSEA